MQVSQHLQNQYQMQMRLQQQQQQQRLQQQHAQQGPVRPPGGQFLLQQTALAAAQAAQAARQAQASASGAVLRRRYVTNTVRDSHEDLSLLQLSQLHHLDPSNVSPGHPGFPS